MNSKFYLLSAYINGSENIRQPVTTEEVLAE
jgi:hypothetical protein